VVVEREQVRAGGTLRGRIAGGAGTRLALLRLEGSPAGTVATRGAVAEANGDGEFVLELPATAAPTTRGEECAVEYVVRTVPDRRRPAADVSDVVVAGRLEAGRLQETSPLPDRMIARFDARRFHIELTEVDVQGGGQVAGRVHLQPGHVGAALVITCRCLEAWRTNGRGRLLNLRHPPLWRTVCIWSQSVPTEWPAGQHWAAFRFALPDRLPPAVEARSIAWRYEVEARHRIRLVPDDVAIATPVGFEIVHG
jgi:hypothetical protein